MSNDGPARGNAALIVSLCLNCLLIGVLVMAVLRFPVLRPWTAMGPPAPAPGGGMGHGMWNMEQLSPNAMMSASPDKADEIRSVIATHRPRIRDLRLASFNARAEAWRMLATPQFDKGAFDKALANIQACDAALETEVLHAVSDSVAILTPEERKAAAAAALERRRDHGWGRGGRGFQQGP